MQSRDKSQCHIVIKQFTSNAVNCSTLKIINNHLYLLVHVPVQTSVFQDEPVLLPLLWKIGFSILLFPQPALAVALTQVSAGNPPLTDWRHGTCCCRRQQGSKTDGGVRKHSSKNTCSCLSLSTCEHSRISPYKMLSPLHFFFDLDISEERSNTCKANKNDDTGGSQLC